MDNKKNMTLIIGLIGLIVIAVAAFFLIKGCTTKEFTVKFNSNGGSAVASQTVKKGEKATEPKAPTREGYTFAGWYLSLNDTTKYDFNKEVTEDIELFAKWTKTGETCTITCGEGEVLDEETCTCVKENNTDDSVTLTVNYRSLSLVVGNTATLRATLKAPDDVDKTITWTSSNEKVVTVKDGKVTAVGAGKATITVSGGGKTVKVSVTVISKDQDNMNKALASMTSKTIEKAGADLNFSSNVCTITNTANTTSDAKTTVENGKVTKLYRSTSATTISSTYSVKCGSLTQSKTVKHTITASPYSYTSTNAGGITVLTVNNGAKDFYFTEGGGLYWVEGTGVQYPKHEKGTTYSMVFNNDVNTTYAVKSAE